ncbi:MAG: hypothetical protein M3071_00540, partial [Actinomycetota bacterium]|nr:hypothetical protein [Actinomycetota bacterium]
MTPTPEPAPGQPLPAVERKTSAAAPRKILAVVTNHDAYENSDERTGLWLGELTHFWEVVSEAGFEIDVVSPNGGRVPLDKRGLGVIVTGGAR